MTFHLRHAIVTTLAVAACLMPPPQTVSAQSSELRWVGGSNGSVPPGAVVGGQEPGRQLYVCRANYQGGVHPGKIVGGNCNIGYGGAEITIPRYEVLTTSEPHRISWVGASGGRLAPNAVVGGQEPGRQLYVCRASYQGGVHPGKVVGSNCNIGWGGREITLPNYEVMVFAPRVVVQPPPPPPPQAPVLSNVTLQSMGLCLDIEGGSTQPGTRTIIYPCHGQTNQRWTLQDGVVRSANGLCLDIEGGAARSGARAIVWSCHGQPNQRWTLQSNGALRSDLGLCLDVEGGRAAPGTGVIAYTCHGQQNQVWTPR